jgi:hypothetical protein
MLHEVWSDIPLRLDLQPTEQVPSVSDRLPHGLGVRQRLIDDLRSGVGQVAHFVTETEAPIVPYRATNPRAGGLVPPLATHLARVLF